MPPPEIITTAIASLAKEEPLETTVRAFIWNWGANRLGSWYVRRINQDLEAAGLVTFPDFARTGLDSHIRIERRSDFTELRPEPEEYGLTVGTLPAATAGVVSVTPGDDLRVAYTRMAINDYSQLPVLQTPHTVDGAVTWQSLLDAFVRDPDAGVADAIVGATEVRYDDDLLARVPDIVENEFVLVRDETNQVSGIVTTADVSALFAERASIFLQLGEIDQRLRYLVQRNFTLAEMREICDRGNGDAPGSFERMSMGDYARVLSKPDHWGRLGSPHDRVEIQHLVNAVREIRNDVMHFNADPLGDEELAKVDGLIRVLRGLAGE